MVDIRPAKGSIGFSGDSDSGKPIRSEISEIILSAAVRASWIFFSFSLYDVLSEAWG